MRVRISGIDMSQDVGPIIRSFYPHEEVVISYISDNCEQSSYINDISENEDIVNLKKDSFLESGKDIEDSIIINLKLYDDKFSIFYTSKDESENGSKDGSENLSMNPKCVRFDYSDIPDEHMSYEKRRHRAYKNLLLREIYGILSEKTGKTLPWGILTGVRPTKLCFERLKNNTVGNITYLTKEYLCSPKKAGLAQKIAAKELELLKKFDYNDGYSLYVGFPFCPSICNYCSFGSHPIDKYGDLVQAYIEALLKELDESCDILKGKKLQTIYFGGGTPTAVSTEQLERVIRRVKDRFDIAQVLEFTVEAGRPDSVDEEKLEMLKAENITRISINPQSMRQKTLDIIGRRHTVEQTIEAFNLARRIGFDNINMDLIAGLTGECFEDMKYTLGEVARLSPDSITVHTLALKRAARLKTESEKYTGMEATDVPEMVEYASDFCIEKGYEPYYLYRQKNMTENLENIGYARPGKEGLYNILIMEEVQQILALGAGASSKFIYRNAENGRRFGRVENVKNVAEYISRIDEMIERKRIILDKRGL